MLLLLLYRYRFMFTPLVVRSEALERTLQSLKDDMEKRIGGDLLGDISPTSIPRQEPITVVGRICCEASDGRINRMSIMLEGSRKDSGGHRVHLDLRDMNPPIFSFFPGQASPPLIIARLFVMMISFLTCLSSPNYCYYCCCC